MDKELELTEQLRLHLLGALHIGTLKPGSKLPSIREVAERHRVDHRLVARVYTRLEEERLVEIRGRSGVYVAFAARRRAQPRDERLLWLANILTDGWSRRITITELHNMMRRATLHRLRCVCVEATQDHLVAVASELASDFGLAVIPARFSVDASGEPDPADVLRVEAEILSADLVVTTVFHATPIRAISERVGKPMVAVSINPAIRDQIAHRILHGKLRIVAADRAFLARAEAFLEKIKGGSNIELALVSDLSSLPNTSVPTLYTRAARRELGLPEFHLISGDVPFISAESAAEIYQLIVGLACSDLPKSD